MTAHNTTFLFCLAVLSPAIGMGLMLAWFTALDFIARCSGSRRPVLPRKRRAF